MPTRRPGRAGGLLVTPASYLVGMPRKPQDGRDQAQRAGVGRAEAMLAAAGLRVVRVDRCPDPACPVCTRPDRAAA